MKVPIICFICITQLAYAGLDQFASAENDIDRISKISVSGNNIAFSGNTLQGKHFITIHLSNNTAEGYKVYLQAKKGILSLKDKSTRDGEGIDYHLQCDDFISAKNGFIVHASPVTNLFPGQEVVIYNVKNPRNVTIDAKTRCSLSLAPGEKINEHFSGKYTETITVRIENY